MLFIFFFFLGVQILSNPFFSRRDFIWLLKKRYIILIIHIFLGTLWRLFNAKWKTLWYRFMVRWIVPIVYMLFNILIGLKNIQCDRKVCIFLYMINPTYRMNLIIIPQVKMEKKIQFQVISCDSSIRFRISLGNSFSVKKNF